MPNNLVFSNVANYMKTQIYGISGSNVIPINVDSSGNLMVSTITTTFSGGTVTVSGGTVAVSGGSLQTYPINTSTDTTVVLSSTVTIDALVADTSIQRMYSFYVKNIGDTNTIDALLMIAPTNTASYYVNDDSTVYTLGPGEMAVLTPAKYLNYTKLCLHCTATYTAAAVAHCYFNAQT